MLCEWISWRKTVAGNDLHVETCSAHILREANVVIAKLAPKQGE